MKKRTKRLLILAAALLLAGLWVWRVVSLNAYYDSIDISRKERYAIGDIVSFGQDHVGSGTLDGYSIRVDSFEILDYEEFRATAPFEVEARSYEPEKIALVTVTVFNDSNENEEDILWLTEFGLHGIDSHGLQSWKLLLAANPMLDNQYLGIQLAKGDQCTLILPYDIRKEMFSNTWSHLEDYHFYLYLTSWPTEKTIQVQ